MLSVLGMKIEMVLEFLYTAADLIDVMQRVVLFLLYRLLDNGKSKIPGNWYFQEEASRLDAGFQELGQSLSDFGKAVKLLANYEGNVLGKAFTELGAKSEILSIKLQKEAHHLLMNFEEPLKDYVRAVQSIKDMEIGLEQIGPSIAKTKNFSYNELRVATSNFQRTNKIGRGGFGTVYKVQEKHEQFGSITCSQIHQTAVS
ncbi:hypothetical protein DH2020_046892 [Rehmannia glutinosa]|uniref:Uncharacterized protein n=1 Tax=Rehmannia glutinosa TaxID=99300 RepID=A0ABR0UA46_REHGL